VARGMTRPERRKRGRLEAEGFDPTQAFAKAKSMGRRGVLSRGGRYRPGRRR
jgi:hypothetical protein